VGYISETNVKIVEATSYNVVNDADVNGLFFIITRTYTLKRSGLSLHATFSLQELLLTKSYLEHDKLIKYHNNVATSITISEYCDTNHPST